jgi:hypothetical protein
MSIAVNNAVAAYNYTQSGFVPTVPPSVNVYVCGALTEYNVLTTVSDCPDNKTPILITWPGGSTNLAYKLSTFPTQPPFLISVQQSRDGVVDIIGGGPWAGPNRSTADPPAGWIPYVLTNFFASGNVLVNIENQSIPPTPTYYDAFGTAVFAVGPRYSYPYAAFADTHFSLEFPGKNVAVFALDISTFTSSVLNDLNGFPTVYLLNENNTLKMYNNPPDMGPAWVPMLIRNTSSAGLLITIAQSAELVPTAYNPSALSSFVVAPNTDAQIILYPDSVITGQLQSDPSATFTQRGNSLAYMKTLSASCVLRYVPASFLKPDPQAYLFFSPVILATISNTGVAGDSPVYVAVEGSTVNATVNPGASSSAITVTETTLLTLAFSSSTNANPFFFQPASVFPGLVNIPNRNGQIVATLNVMTLTETGNYSILVYTYPAAPYLQLNVLSTSTNPGVVSVSVTQSQIPKPTPFDTNATTKFETVAGMLAQPLIIYSDTTLHITSGTQTMSFQPAANVFGTYYLYANNTLAYYIAVTYAQGILNEPNTLTIQTTMPLILASHRASSLNVMLTAHQSEPNVKNSWNETPNAPLQFTASVGQLHYTAFPDTVFDISIFDKVTGAAFVSPFTFSTQTAETHTLVANQVLLVYTLANGVSTLSINTNPDPGAYIQQTFSNSSSIPADLVLTQNALPWACPWDPVGSLTFSVPPGSTYNVVAYFDTMANVAFPSAVPAVVATDMNVVPPSPDPTSLTTWYTNTSISYKSLYTVAGSVSMAGIIANQATASTSLTTFTLQPQGTWMAITMQNQTPEFTIYVQALQKEPIVPTLYDPHGDAAFTLLPGNAPYAFAAYADTTWAFTCDLPATQPLLIPAGVENTYDLKNLANQVIARITTQKDTTSNPLTNPNPFRITVHANLQQCTFVSTVGGLQFVDGKWQPSPWPQVGLELIQVDADPIAIKPNVPLVFDGSNSLQIKVTITWFNAGSVATTTEFLAVSVPNEETTMYYPDLSLRTGPELVKLVITPTPKGSTITCSGLGAWDANRSTAIRSTSASVSIPIPITITNSSSSAALFHVSQSEEIVPSVWDPNGLKQFYVQPQNAYTFLAYDSTVFNIQVNACANPVVFSASSPYTQAVNKGCLFLTYQADTTTSLPRASNLSIAAPPYALRMIMDFQPYVHSVTGQYSSTRTGNDPVFGFNLYSDSYSSYGTLTDDRKPVILQSFVKALDTVCTCEVWVNNSAGTQKMYLTPFQFTGNSKSCTVLLQDQGHYIWFELQFLNTVATNGELSLRVVFAKPNEELADVFAVANSGQTAAYGNVASPIVPGVLAAFATANVFAVYNDAPNSNLNVWGSGLYMPDSSMVTTYGGIADVVKTLPADDPRQLFTFDAVDGGKWWALKNVKYGYLNVQNAAVSHYTGLSITLTPQSGKISVDGNAYTANKQAVSATSPQWMVAQRAGGGPGVLLVRQGVNGTPYAVETGSLRFTNGTVDSSAVCKGFMKVWQGGVRVRRAWLPCGPVIATTLQLVGPSTLTCADTLAKTSLTYSPPATSDTVYYKTALTLNVVSNSACGFGQVAWVWPGSNIQTCPYPTSACPVRATVAGQMGCTKYAPKTYSRVPAYGLAILLLLSLAIVAIAVCIGVYMHGRKSKKHIVS